MKITHVSVLLQCIFINSYVYLAQPHGMTTMEFVIFRKDPRFSLNGVALSGLNTRFRCV